MIREAKNAAKYVSLPKKSTIPKKSLWKKLKRFFVDNKWPLIGSIWVVAFSLGYIGFSEYFSATGEIYYFWDIFYRTLQLLALESGFVSGSIGWELQIARFLIPAVAAYTAVQALAIIFKEQIQMFRLRLMKNHVVICGLGEKGLLLSNGFREKDEHVVVIEKDGNNGLLKQCKEQGTIILSGNAADPIQLRRARVNKAKYLISVCGDDGANAEVAVRARELVLSRKGRALSCLIHISDSQLCDLLRERELKLGKLDAFRMELFNVFESGARILLDEYPPFNKTSNDHNSSPHLVIVGMGHIGENLIVNATRKWLDRSKNNSGLLRFSLIDKEAVKKKESLYLRYPKLKKVCDLMPVEADIRTLEFNQTKFIFNEQVQSGVTIVYICMDNDLDALRAGLAIRQQFMALDTPIVISMIQDKGPAILLKGGEDKQDIFNNLHIFGILEHTCTPDLISRCTYEILARAIHADYVQRERAKGHTPLTNPSAVPWGELEEAYKISNMRVAEHIRIKLDAIGCDIAITNDWDVPKFEFTPQEVELLAKMEHKRWVEEKLSDGWIYGLAKDLRKKTTPYIVTWDDLPEVEKDKDREQVRYLPQLLAKARFEIYRTREKQL